MSQWTPHLDRIVEILFSQDEDSVNLPATREPNCLPALSLSSFQNNSSLLMIAFSYKAHTPFPKFNQAVSPKVVWQPQQGYIC